MVAEDKGEGGADLASLNGTDEDVQRRGEGRAARALLAAHGEVEAHAVALADGRRHGDVLGLGGRTVVRAPGDRDVELARKVREGLVAQEDSLEFRSEERRVGKEGRFRWSPDN